MNEQDTEIETGTETETEAAAPRNRRVSFTAVLVGGLAVILTLVGLDIVLINGTKGPTPRPVIQVMRLSGAPAVLPTVYLTVSPGVKPGPDGKLHDAFSVTNFDVHAGQPVKLVINNTDTAPHSINAPGANVNIVVRPGVHTYTLLVQKTGSFEWYCMMPCDPYSMAHVGYMRGYIESM